MIFKELAKSTYNYIIEIELVFLRRYKIDPFQLFSKMTLLDFESYIARIEGQIKEEEKRKDSKDFGKSLIAIRDILNYMTLGD